MSVVSGLVPPIIATITADAAEFAEQISSAQEKLASFTATPGVAQIGASTADLEAKIAEAQAELDSLGETGERAVVIAANIDDLQAKIGEAQGQLADLTADDADEVVLRANIDDWSAKMAEAQAELDALGAEGDRAVVLNANIDEYQAKMAEADATTTETTESAEKGISGTGVMVAAAIAAVAAAGVELGSKYQEALAQISAQAGISSAAAKRIGDAFLSTAGDSTFTAEQIAQAYGPVAGQLGTVAGHALSAGQALTVMKAATDLAEASNSNLTSTTSALASVMQAYGLAAGQATSASDTLFETAAKTGNSVSSVASTVQRLHSQLGSVTPSLQQVGGLMVDLAAHGETGRQAVSAVSSSMQTLLKSATASAGAMQTSNALLGQMSPQLRALAEQYLSGQITSEGFTTATEGLTGTQAALATQFASAANTVKTSEASYKALGLTVTNSKGQFVGMSSVIDQLHQHIEGMTQAQALAYLSTVLGAAGARKMLDVIDAGPAAYDKATASVSKLGAAHTAAEKQASTFEGEEKKLKATGEDLATSIGDVLIPGITHLGDVVLGVVRFFEQHKAAAEALAGVLAGVAAGAVVFLGNKITDSLVDAAKGAIKMMGDLATSVGEKLGLIEASEEDLAATSEATGAETEAAFGPIGLVFAALGLAGMELATHWSEVKRIVVDAWDGIKDAALSVYHGVLTAFDAVTGFLKRWGPLVLTAVAPVLGLPLLIAQHWDTIESDVRRIWDDVLGFLTDVWHGIERVFEDATIVGLILSHWTQIQADATRVWDAILGFVEGIPGDIVGFFASLGSDLAGVAHTAWEDFLAGATTAWTDVSSFVESIPGKILAGLGDVGSMLLDAGKSIIEGLVHGIEDGEKDVIDAVKKVGSDIVGAFKSVLSIFSPSQVMADEVGANIVAGLAQGIQTNSNAAVDAVNNLTTTLMEEGQTSAAAAADAIAQTIGSNLQDGLASITPSVVSQFTELADQLTAAGESSTGAAINQIAATLSASTAPASASSTATTSASLAAAATSLTSSSSLLGAPDPTEAQILAVLQSAQQILETQATTLGQIAELDTETVNALAGIAQSYAATEGHPQVNIQIGSIQVAPPNGLDTAAWAQAIRNELLQTTARQTGNVFGSAAVGGGGARVASGP